MVMRRLPWGMSLVVLLVLAVCASAQETGSIRGTIYDKEFESPLAAAQVILAETGQKVTAGDQGNYLADQVPPGTYTLIFSKDGYTRQVKADVVVAARQMTEVDASLSGDFEEMEEFVVVDVEIGGSTESGLLNLRIESPSLMDIAGADLISRTGASDAAGALKLVAGATVQDGKYAVVRGLPDRYVSSQMNGVRLPTADTDKRAVELDQFPAAVIESIQVSKTFTPDQQGDASGGAVNVVLKGIPNENVFKFDTGASFNTQSAGRDDFLTYRGGKLNFWGKDNRDIPSDGLFDSPVGVYRDGAPVDGNWSLALGGKHEFETGIKIGGFSNFYYKRDSSFFDEGVDDSYWVDQPGQGMTPQYYQGTPAMGDFKTALFDVTQGSESVQWSWLGTVGIESRNHALNLVYMYTRTAENTATLSEDTRGKSYYFPGYTPGDPNNAGNQNPQAAPYLRTETIEYAERTTETLQLHGRHTIEIPEFGKDGFFKTLSPEVDWAIAGSSAGMYQPDKRQFGSVWLAGTYNAGFPPFVPPFTTPQMHQPFKPAANFTMGNLQRTWKEIDEDSEQYFVNVKFPFEQWNGEEGYLKLGYFDDQVTRTYTQESFSNFNDNAAQYLGPWESYWSEVFPYEIHPTTAAEIDVDYEGQQRITAGYYMVDLPLTSFLKVIGGMRYEKTQLEITNQAETDVTWIPPGALGPVSLGQGDADVSFQQKDMLPSLGLVITPIKELKLRGSYSETLARQTFKELTPIQQQEYLGGDVFIGNPGLQMSSLKNYDFRIDYTPEEGSLLSLSLFRKEVLNPIEYVQRNAGFTYTTPVNYPEGTLKGVELEVRQRLGSLWDKLDGLSVGANATFIDSEVRLPQDEIDGFNLPNIRAPMSERHMTGAPEYLCNLHLTYDLERTGTQFTLAYNLRGDTLVAGAGQSNGHFVPSVYETPLGTLNLGVTQKLGKHWKLKFQAKNLTDPKIEKVYRSDYIGDDVTKTSYRKGIDFSIGISAEFNF